MNATHLFLFSAFLLSLVPAVGVGQDFAPGQSLGVSLTYSPDSSHILIGRSEQRRTWTAGIEYGRKVYANRSISAYYEASVSPLFLERDPTVSGTFAKLPDGETISFPGVPFRVVTVSNQPIAYVGGLALTPVPIYANGYGAEETYAASLSPLGTRINAFNSHKIQPTFSADGGLVLARRNLPVDGSSSVNFLFSFGPGIELFYKPNRAVRIEYLYRHMSNANIGSTNPGVDQGLLRVTFMESRR